MLKKRLKPLNGFLLLRTLAIGILPISALTAEANYVLTLDIENQAIHVEVTTTNLPAEEITISGQSPSISLSQTYEAIPYLSTCVKLLGLGSFL